MSCARKRIAEHCPTVCPTEKVLVTFAQQGTMIPLMSFQRLSYALRLSTPKPMAWKSCVYCSSATEQICYDCYELHRVVAPRDPKNTQEIELCNGQSGLLKSQVTKTYEDDLVISCDGNSPNRLLLCSRLWHAKIGWSLCCVPHAARFLSAAHSSVWFGWKQLETGLPGLPQKLLSRIYLDLVAGGVARHDE